MVRNSGKPARTRETDIKGIIDADIDALFALPLAEFTDARNTLATRLKKNGRSEDAVLVKALAKPPVSAWAVNQLYWNHREAFDRLIASGERFHKAQTSDAKVGDTRGALDARREALTQLSDLAMSVLRDAGHKPSLDTTRRITSTLEAISAMSVYASGSDAPRPGRLTVDVDPPGFESLASWIPSARTTQSTKEPTRSTSSQKSRSGPTKTRRKVAPDGGVRQLKETRKAKIAAAKVSLQDAKRSLAEAQARARSLEAAQKKGDAEVKNADRQRLYTEDELTKAKAASEDATQRARSVAADAEEAARAMMDAKRTVTEAFKELESLFRESSGK